MYKNDSDEKYFLARHREPTFLVIDLTINSIYVNGRRETKKAYSVALV